MNELCTLCLCSGRKLQFIEETTLSHIYSEILNEIPVYKSEVCVQICWECRHSLGKLQRFKDQVKVCYMEMLQYLQMGHQDLYSLSRQPHLQTENVISIDYPEIKLEFDALDTSMPDEETYEKFDITVGQPFMLLDNVDHVDESVSGVKEEENEAKATFADDVVCEKSVKKKKKVSKIKPAKVKKKTKVKLKNKVSKIKKKKRLETSDSDDVSIKSDGNDFHDDEDFDFNTKTGEEEKIGDDKEDCNEIEKRVQETENDKEFPAQVPEKPVVQKVVRAPRGSINTSERPECAECGKVFSSRKTLKYHLNVLHNGNNRYPCPQCGKVYQWKSNLGRHIRSHKAREKGELYCALCDKAFASVATYRQHLSVSKQHVSESDFSFTCDECGKKFVNKTRLRDHIDWEHLQKIKFRCQLCNKPFKCHTSLYVHMNNVHRNKGLKDNLCHVCGKSYQNRAKLRYHIVAMHTSETPYQCSQCTAAFGWYSSLYRHVREVHYKMKIHPSKVKKGKKKVSDQLDTIIPAPHIVLPQHQNNIMS